MIVPTSSVKGLYLLRPARISARQLVYTNTTRMARMFARVCELPFRVESLFKQRVANCPRDLTRSLIGRGYKAPYGGIL